MRMIVAFEKTEQVRHIGHLDLMRAMHRALRRSGLPIRYSQGFNPHVLLSFASPLPVGVSGAEELMDIPLSTEGEAMAFFRMLEAALPPSLPPVSARLVEDNHPKLMATLQTAEYAALFPAGEGATKMAEAVPRLLARPEIQAVRKTKSRETVCDIRPMLHALSAERAGNDGMRFVFRVDLMERSTLRPGLLLETLAGEAGVELPDYRLRRLRLYGKAGAHAVPLMEQ